MASQRRSLPALNMLKSQHERRIANYHKPKQKAVAEKGKQEIAKQAKEIIDDVEEYIFKTWGKRVSKRLKCELHSSYKDNMKVIEVVVNFHPTAAAEERRVLEELKAAEKKDIMSLDSWYTSFLSNCAGGGELPEFDPHHLRNIGYEYRCYYDSETTM